MPRMTRRPARRPIARPGRSGPRHVTTGTAETTGATGAAVRRPGTILPLLSGAEADEPARSHQPASQYAGGRTRRHDRRTLYRSTDDSHRRGRHLLTRASFGYT